MLRRTQRAWDHLLVSLGLRESTDDWMPSTTYRVALAALGALLAYRFVSEAWETRGPLLGLAAAAVSLWIAVTVARRGTRSAADFVERRPYADASFSIPIGLFATLLLFPRWSVPLCLLVTVVYAALVYGLTYRRLRSQGGPIGDR